MRGGLDPFDIDLRQGIDMTQNRSQLTLEGRELLLGEVQPGEFGDALEGKLIVGHAGGLADSAEDLKSF